ncbi:MAG: HEAT repeat domain-containing protein [Desulfatirhabdiaceae bacterium]|nr:HEAT repeat domain-containing protein [Desulfatirhabdiaceae bacterium]
MGITCLKTSGSIRELKEKLTALFSKGEMEAALTAICRMPLRKAVNALFPFFYSKDPLHFWQAVTAMGAVVSLLAGENMESARVVMRRLMWSLNDESGGIGWGSAEAMGEIMARNDPMADEYACILISYINPCGNFIDHPDLQKGILWGLGRLAQDRPHRAEGASEFLVPFLTSSNPVLRGLAAWTASALPGNATKPLLIRLSSDIQVIPLFMNGRLCEVTIGSLAQSHP